MLSFPLLERLEQEQERFREIEEKLADPFLTKDPALLKQLIREHAQLKRRSLRIDEYLRLYRQWEQTNQLSLSEEETDKELQAMAKAEADQLAKKLKGQRKEMELMLIPSSLYEGRNLFMEIRAGTGGEEAALFVTDLSRMYLRFVERHAFKAEIISNTPTEIGGYKEIVFLIEGADAYLLLHREGGIHRVQRIPSTESGGRIHTSAVTVAVLPEKEESEVKINDADLDINVFRASGAGGQHVNKTESAIRITHIPSGLVVSCQDERSQHKNKVRAMSVLRSRLADIQEHEAHSEENILKRKQIKSGDRSERIRTYNFPQGRVTDHRIGYTSYNLEAFIDGEIDDLLKALVQAEREEKLQAL